MWWWLLFASSSIGAAQCDWVTKFSIGETNNVLSSSSALTQAFLSCLGETRYQVQIGSFTPPISTNYAVRVNTVELDAVMEIREGDCTSTRFMACKDDLDNSPSSTGFNSIYLKQNMTYTIIVSSFSNNTWLPANGTLVEIKINNPCNEEYEMQRFILRANGGSVTLKDRVVDVGFFAAFQVDRQTSYFINNIPVQSMSLYMGDFRGDTCVTNTSSTNNTMLIAKKKFGSITLFPQINYTLFIVPMRDAKRITLYFGANDFVYQFAHLSPVLFIPFGLALGFIGVFLCLGKRHGLFVEPRDADITTWRRWCARAVVCCILVMCTGWALPYSAISIAVAFWGTCMEIVHLVRSTEARFQQDWVILLLVCLQIPFSGWNLIAWFQLAVTASDTCDGNGSCLFNTWLVPAYGVAALLFQFALAICEVMRIAWSAHLAATYSQRIVVCYCPHCSEPVLQPTYTCGTCTHVLEYNKFGAYRKCPGCSAVIEKNGGCDHMTCSQCAIPFSWLQASYCCPQCSAEFARDAEPSSVDCVHCNLRLTIHEVAIARMLPVQVNNTSEPTCNAAGRRASVTVANDWVEDWLKRSTQMMNDDDADDDESLVELDLCLICEERRSTWRLACGHSLCKPCLVKVLEVNQLCPFDRLGIETPPVHALVQVALV